MHFTSILKKLVSRLAMDMEVAMAEVVMAEVVMAEVVMAEVVMVKVVMAEVVMVQKAMEVVAMVTGMKRSNLRFYSNPFRNKKKLLQRMQKSTSFARKSYSPIKLSQPQRKIKMSR